jgi:GNAT superfamily N-acetyltransferase
MATIIQIPDLEVPALAGLRAESLREGYRFIERLCDDWVSGANRFGAPGEALFIALSDGPVVGVCGINRDPYAGDPHTGRVRRLYVSPAHRRSGVGRALLAAVIAHGRSHYRRLRVRTPEAGEFYSARGFRSVASETDATHVFELIHPA